MKKLGFIMMTVVLMISLFSCLIKLNNMVDMDTNTDKDIASGVLDLPSENLDVIVDDDKVVVHTGEIINEYKLVQPKTNEIDELLVYISELTEFSYEDSQYLMDKCEEKDIDVFLVLAIFRKESGFIPNTTGGSGEIGLGQIMERTAEYFCEQLGYEFSRELVYDVKVNIDITVENLEYLLNYYKGNLHSSLTAYNRGMGGLNTYIAEGRSPFHSPNMSTYSVSAVNYMNMYKEQFKNLEK